MKFGGRCNNELKIITKTARDEMVLPLVATDWLLGSILTLFAE